MGSFAVLADFVTRVVRARSGTTAKMRCTGPTSLAESSIGMIGPRNGPTYFAADSRSAASPSTSRVDSWW
jgi:hypothetical protein